MAKPVNVTRSIYKGVVRTMDPHGNMSRKKISRIIKKTPQQRLQESVEYVGGRMREVIAEQTTQPSK